MAGFCALPNEIIEQIVNELSDRAPILFNLCLVDRRHRDLLEPLLYSHVTIRSAVQSHQLALALENFPEKCAPTQHLTFERNSPLIGSTIAVNDGNLVRRMPKLKTLNVNAWRSRQGIWQSIQRLTVESGPNSPFQNLEKLQIQGLPRREPIWPEAIMRLPRLTHVRFSLCRLSSEPAEWAPVPPSTTILQSRAEASRSSAEVADDLPPLKVLSLAYFDIDPKTFRALINARPLKTIYLEEINRVKYTAPREFLGSPSDFIEELKNSPVASSPQFNHFVHTDPQSWGCRKLDFSSFENLTYLEVGAWNVYEAMEEVTQEAGEGANEALQHMLPKSLQILAMRLPKTDCRWQLFEGFIHQAARHKQAVMPDLRVIMWKCFVPAHSPHEVSGEVRAACQEVGIEAVSVWSTHMYNDWYRFHVHS